MTVAKIGFTVGAMSFSGEGDEEWVAAQLDKILDRANELVNLAPIQDQSASDDAGTGANNEGTQKPLPTFLNEKSAKQPQVKKFLATAVWLHDKGQTRLSTVDVNKAIKDANQGRLANASDCLNQNVAKGYAEKEGNKFFVTPDGISSL